MQTQRAIKWEEKREELDFEAECDYEMEELE